MKSFSFFHAARAEGRGFCTSFSSTPPSATFNFGCQISTSHPLKDKCFAATNPSPPLFPGPHKNSILLSSFFFPWLHNISVSRTSATASPASSINCSSDHPCSVNVIRATSISAAVSASTYFFIPPSSSSKFRTTSLASSHHPSLFKARSDCDTF